jgi:hypothetical protein
VAQLAAAVEGVDESGGKHPLGPLRLSHIIFDEAAQARPPSGRVALALTRRLRGQLLSS